MTVLYAVYGASGFGREVMPFAREVLANSGGRLVFIDDALSGSTLNSVEVLSFELFMNRDADQRYAVLAIADPTIRKNLFERLESNKVKHWSIKAPNVVILDDCTMGENSILAPFVTLTSNVKIGKSFHANLYSYVAHDCEIGDFVTFAPGVMCNGNVIIESNVYIGSGVVIKQGKPGKPIVIGEGAIIGMGAIITKSVPPKAVVLARPNKPLERRGLGN